MVEPAIGITAANISTLRPLFQKVLNAPYYVPFFKSKANANAQSLPKPDKSVSSTSDDGDYEESRTSGSRPATGRKSGGTNGKFCGWNEEFAGLLGLTPTGVTTHISAGRQEREHPLAKLRRVWGRKNEEEDGPWGDDASQRELKGSVTGVSGGWCEMNGGIVKTVTTTFEI
jgi:hypothetical protein